MATATAYRLPTDVQPLKYDIMLAPDLTNFTFRGEQTVDVAIAAPTKTISVNATELEIDHVQLTLADGAIVYPRDIQANEDTETVAFAFAEEVPAGNAALNMHFRGTLNDQLRGFYRSRYPGLDGQDRYLAATQFEATDARRAFPCWDDPAVKAVFQVTLVVPEELVAISNTLIETETSLGDGTKAVRFGPSPTMSTYLVAFIVGDMACVEAAAASGTLIRVWTTRGKEAQGQFALENSIRLLDYYNDYFGIPYPLPKLDHIAVPDFAAGAMENWGAITYRETALLYDPANSAAAARQRILEVVSHEMAHMWFGDLVTMEWWDDLWLNESFASWMGDKAVDALYPEWTMWTQFVSHDTNSALSLDGLRNSHPIEARVGNPAEIRELFDAISYSKGGSTLRMLEHYLSPEVFQKGLRRYLTENQYGNARTEDLWKALEATSGLPVTTVMDSWVKQTGYPLLRADVDRSGNQLTVHLTQKRFLYDSLLEEGNLDDTVWQVPVSTLQKSGGEIETHLMTDQTIKIAHTEVGATRDWLKVNPGQTGFYRVNYAPEEWERLRAAVARKELSPTDRLGLQNDAYALARAGMAPATAFLDLAEAYREEDDATVWGDLASNLRGMEALLTDQPYFEQFRTFGRWLFEDVSRRVGWNAEPGEGHLESLRRSIVLGQSGGYGDPAVITEARARFRHYLTDPATVPPDLRGVVFGVTAQEGDSETFETFWDLERQVELQEEKMRFLGALSRFQDRGLLREALERSMDPKEVRSQDTVLLVTAVASNRYGHDLTWEFVKERWDELDRRYGKGGFAIMRLVSLTGAFTSLERAQEVDDFFKAHPAPSAARTIQQSLERIRLNHAWLQRNSHELAQWFDRWT